jgi:DNA-binding transcriptional LysR family regulator
MDRFDIVVHIGELPLSNLVGYTIAPNARFVCAAPALLKRLGAPDSPDALSRLPCIVLRENNEDVSLWQFSKGRTRRSVRVSAHLSCNDGDVIRQWACEGRGVILRSERDGAHASARGSAGAHPAFHAVLAEPVQAAAAVAALSGRLHARRPTFSLTETMN